MRLLLPTMLSVALAATSAAAATATPPAQTASLPAAEAPALTPQQQGAIRFVSGGTSIDDRAVMHDLAKGYNMRLMFAVQPSGQYLADVGVTVADMHGKTLVNTIADGPLFYAELPPGAYRVSVTSEGRTQDRTIDVGATGGASQAFYWRQAG